MDYSSEPFRVDDLGQVARLHSRLMPRRRGANQRYLTWKYFENPHIENPLITVIRYGDEIVGMEGLVGMAWDLDPQSPPTIIPQADDLIVHPDHRRKGLSGILGRDARAAARNHGYPAVISMSAGDLSQALSVARGWEDVRDLDRVYLNRRGGTATGQTHGAFRGRVRSKANGLARRLGHTTENPPSDRIVDRAMERVPGTNPNVTVSPDADVDAMSALATAVGSHTSDRSADYIRWRVGNPDRKYRFVYWRDPELRGYMIVGWSGEHPERVMVVDHCCEDESVFADLLEAVTRIPKVDVELMASTLPAHLTKVTRQFGFRADPQYTFKRRRFFLWPFASDDEKTELVNGTKTWRVDLIDMFQG